MTTLKHFINLKELDAEILKDILKSAHDLKAQKFAPPQIFKGLTLAMLFDKRSTRTRMSFDVAMKQLGGHSIVLSKDDIQLGGSESIESTAKVMSRYVDAIMVRISDHDKLEELARHATVPVINAMTDISHPCQIMADIMTIEEKLGAIEGKKVAWFGDYNNVTMSFVDASTKFGFDFVISSPTSPLYPPAGGGKATAGSKGGAYFEPDPARAAKNADVIVTDTWVSMGQEGKGIEKFEPYQVNAALMAQAKDTAIFMHCLPIHEWEEVTENVAKSPQSVIYDEAENRLHAQKAILAYCLKDAGVRIKKD